jgi:hypothetical protein
VANVASVAMKEKQSWHMAVDILCLLHQEHVQLRTISKNIRNTMKSIRN